MNIAITQEGNVAVVRPSGKLLIGDPETAMNETVARVIGEGRVHLLIDLAGVTAMDSSGVDTLVRAWQLTQQRGGAMKLMNATPRIQKLLELTGLTSVWELHSDAERALSSFRAGDRPSARV